MERFTLRTPMPASAQELYDWHAHPAGFFRLMPPWESLQVVRQEKPFGDGHQITIRTPILGPIKLDWLAELFEVIPGQQFRDRELHGPFAEWVHTHRMIATSANSSELEDSIDYRVPFGAIGRLFGGGMVRGKLEQLFRFRHAVTASDMRRHGAYRDKPRLKIAITGASGLVGQELSSFLAVGGHQVIRLSRSKPQEKPYQDGCVDAQWNPGSPDVEQFEGLDAVIHLAGENIADKRWSDARKQALRDSRVGPTRLLADTLARCKNPPKVLISASGTGIYGNRGSEELSESSSLGSDFLGQLARDWEAALEPAEKAGIRTVPVRFGIVLSARGGALAKQLLAFRTGNGAVLGSGEQYVSWITLNDLVGAIHFILMNDAISGPVNGVAPNPVTNRVFGRTLAKVLHRPYLFTIPGPVLRVMFGELAELLLASQRVRPDRLNSAGFTFDHPDLDSALRFCLGCA
jgi:uncharacterized protein